MSLSIIGILALALVCAWTFGGIALRLGGGLSALAGLVGLSLTGNASGVLVSALGVCLWLAGRLHFRLRHGAFKSALADRLCLAAASAGRRFAGDRDQRSAVAAGRRCVASAEAISGCRGRLREGPGRGDWRRD